MRQSLPVRFLPLLPVYPFLNISTRFFAISKGQKWLRFLPVNHYLQVQNRDFQVHLVQASGPFYLRFYEFSFSFITPKSAHYAPWSEQPNHCFYHCGCLECFCDDATTVFAAPLSTCFTHSLTCLCLPNLACLN